MTNERSVYSNCINTFTKDKAFSSTVGDLPRCVGDLSPKEGLALVVVGAVGVNAEGGTMIK
jgi:hypothetical protein